MTPSEKNIVKSLIAVAWADGKVQQGELGVIEGLLCGFDASEQEEQELLDYASSPRTMDGDIPLSQLPPSDRELLLQNAALLVMTDGVLSAAERDVLEQLCSLLEVDAQQLEQAIVEAHTKPEK